jgi:hypothetical protein
VHGNKDPHTKAPVAVEHSHARKRLLSSAHSPDHQLSLGRGPGNCSASNNAAKHTDSARQRTTSQATVHSPGATCYLNPCRTHAVTNKWPCPFKHGLMKGWLSSSKDSSWSGCNSSTLALNSQAELNCYSKRLFNSANQEPECRTTEPEQRHPQRQYIAAVAYGQATAIACQKQVKRFTS